MKKLLISFAVIGFGVQVLAGPGGKAGKFTQAQLNRVARPAKQIEPLATGKSSKPANYGDVLDRIRNKRGPGSSNSILSTIEISTLGESVNPFTAAGNGRTNLFANPKLNTVSFARRGGPNDTGGPHNAPEGRVFYDLNTKGGLEDQWQISKGILYENRAYDLIDHNRPGRYPQGLVWAPPGSTDTNSALVFSVTPTQDGSNGNWGGLARGWQKLESGALPKESYTGSATAGLFHYVPAGMDLNFVTGHIFFVEPEKEIFPNDSISFKNKITLYQMIYNIGTNDWDSTVTSIPFSANSVASSAIAFAPDGLTGYIAVLAESPAFGVTGKYAPFVSKTTDGGNTWSEFQVVNLNPESSTGMDSLRNQWLGSYVKFQNNLPYPVANGTQGAYKVLYSTLFDFDITVDKYNYCHLITPVMATSFQDSVGENHPIEDQNYGYWLTDFCLKETNSPLGFVFGKTQSLRGCWGDCSGSAFITEDNRPQTTRNADGTLLGFCWFDTDTALHPNSNGYENSNPDLWTRFVRVKADGQYSLTPKIRNVTIGSAIEGNVICGNISPYMLPSPTGDSTFSVPASALVLSVFAGTTSPWPVQHVYFNGFTTVAKQDSFPVEVQLFRITGTKPLQSVGISTTFLLSPNPAGNTVFINFSTPKPLEAILFISNALGQVIDRKTIKVLEGENRIPITTSTYKTGIYSMSVSVGEQRVSKRFVKE